MAIARHPPSRRHLSPGPCEQSHGEVPDYRQAFIPLVFLLVQLVQQSCYRRTHSLVLQIQLVLRAKGCPGLYLSRFSLVSTLSHITFIMSDNSLSRIKDVSRAASQIVVLQYNPRPVIDGYPFKLVPGKSLVY